MIASLLLASGSMILQSELETHALNVDTTLGILPGWLSFGKDITSTMDSYFSHAPNGSTNIDIWSYTAKLENLVVSSNPNHRFVVEDMVWNPFVVTVQSSALTTTDGSIPANNISYVGNTRVGTGKALTAAPTVSSDIGTAPVTFVARDNDEWLSLFAQEITLKVNIPPAQKPWEYAGTLTFTY